MLDRMTTVAVFLQSIPPVLVYVVVGAVIGVESLGVPLPGEVMLVGAALLSSRHDLAVHPAGVGAAAALGAVIGDSIGYSIGRQLGMPLFDWLGRRFPRHFGPGHVAFAERLFARFGSMAVFFGRFVALLRILAGPLAGALKMHYRRFLTANVAGAVCWAGGTTALIYFAGLAAERWLARFSWIALVVAVVAGVVGTVLVRGRIADTIAALEAEYAGGSDAASSDRSRSGGLDPDRRQRL